MIIPALLLLPSLAQAHPGVPGHVHGFANGLVHPLTGLDHLLAMIAVGIFAAQSGGRALWLVPAAFVSTMVIGGMIGISGIGEIPFVEQAIAGSLLVFGILIATAARLSLPAGVAVIGFFALFHGYAHGAEMPAASGRPYGLGFILVTAALLGVGITIGLARQKMGSLTLSRCVGGVIAAAGACLIFTA